MKKYDFDAKKQNFWRFRCDFYKNYESFSWTHHAVVIEASHGREILLGDLGREMAHDQRVSVGWVADNEDLVENYSEHHH